MVLENDQNGAENEGIFVPTRHPSPRRRRVYAIKMDFLLFDKGVLRLGEGILRLQAAFLGLCLRLGEALPSPLRSSSPRRRLALPWRTQGLCSSVFGFLLFLPSSLFAFLSIPVKLTSVKD